ncbi:hypothetical protein LIA77_08839 [Sarocladium implicatum]|nr:hypothetical protein LIA77_08839 [Sarocladium implicatum]
MLYKTLLVTYALGLAGFAEAAPAVARNVAAQDVCATQSDCSEDTYCIRATPETEYTCMTQQQAQAIVNEAPETTKRALVSCVITSSCPDFVMPETVTKMKRDCLLAGWCPGPGESILHLYDPLEKRSACASTEDCGEGTHCVQLEGEADYTCRTTEEIVGSAP